MEKYFQQFFTIMNIHKKEKNGKISLTQQISQYTYITGWWTIVEKDVFPYLPDVMSHLLQILNREDNSQLYIKLKEFSFSCISSIGLSAGWMSSFLLLAALTVLSFLWLAARTTLAVVSVACAAKTNLNPYFPQMMEHFKKYLSGFDSQEMKEIQLQAMGELW